MASRFPGRPGPERARVARGSRDGGLGEWWAGLAGLALVGTAVLSLAGSTSSAPPSPSDPVDPTEGILEVLQPAERALGAVESAFGRLCSEPVLLALDLEPDCETGALTLPDELFDGFGSAQLRVEAEADVAVAVSTYLSQLRRLPAIWESLEAIEFRGHTDPRAVRDPYTTNLVGSQQRALGVLLFLIGPDGLPESDQQDLQELAVVSGASFSRPPASCPEESRECYSAWRRVEIRPVLSEILRRGDWSRTVEEIRVATDRARERARSARTEQAGR